MRDSVPKFLSLLIVIADAGLVLGLLGLLIPGLRRGLRSLLGGWQNELVFAIALTSTAGSLALSELADYPPCELCWYQRVIIFPMIILFGLAVFGKNRDARIQGIVFSCVGLIVAAYHTVLQLGVKAIVPCSDRALAVPCGEVLFRGYGYVTLPVMSLTAFALILFVLIVGSKKRDRSAELVRMG